MTISTTDDPRAGPFNGNGVQTAFPFEFKVFAEEDLLVVRADADGVETTLVLDSDYSVTLNADQNADPGGTVTATVAPPTGETLTILSNLEFTQETDITNGGGFYPQVVEDMVDRSVMLAKQVNEKVNRALQLAVSTPDGVSVTLPVPEASKVIGWSADGLTLANFAPDTSISTAQLEDRLADTTSASNGTGLIGWLRAATGAVASTLYAWLDWQNVHVFEFMTLAQRIDWKARTKTLDVTAAIQAAIDHVEGQDGGRLIFATGAGRISSSLEWKSYVYGEGQYGENTHSGVTAEAGVELAWYGAINTPMVRFFGARLFGFEGFVLNGRGVAGSTGILLDCVNTPSGSQNEFSKLSIRDCAVGVQWGTSGIAGGGYANDGTRFSTFTIWSSVAGSKGFVVNSGNAGQMSTIESGGIQVQDIGIDLVVSNILQIRRVFGGGVMDTAFIRASVAIDTSIEGCASECWGTGRTWRTNRPKFLKVVRPVEPYPVVESSITMSGNQINNPIEVSYPSRITSTGDNWGYCKDYTTGVDEPAKGNFIACPAWSAVTAYVANQDAVLSGGVNYQCVLDNTNQVPPNTTYWRVAPSSVSAVNNGVAPGSISLTTGEPAMGWIDSAYVALSNLDPARGWVRPPYSAAYFTTNGAGGWTVDAADVEFYGYTLLNRTMTVSFSIVASSVIAVVGNELRIAIPNGKIASHPMANPVYLYDAGAAANGFATVTLGATYITVKRLNAANFTASVNATEVRGQITFMVD